MKSNPESLVYRPFGWPSRSGLVMWVILSFIFATHPLEGTAPVKRIYIAQFGHGVFDERTFSTEISIDNNSTTDVVDLTIESLDDNGAPIPLLSDGPDGPKDTLSKRVERNALRTIFSVNGTASDLAVGWVRITCESAAADIDVQAVFRIVGPDGLETRAGISGRMPEPSSAFFGESLREVGEGEETIRTGIALVVPQQAAADVLIMIQAVDAEGEPLGDSIEIALAPGAKRAVFLDELISDLPDFAGRVEVRSDAPIVVTPLIQEGVVLTSRETFALP